MLKKLLKHDMKAIFRYWWIAVIICLSLSAAGGFSLMLDQYEGWVPEVLSAATSVAYFLAYGCYCGMIILTLVLLFVRFFKNFFSDEGYLTFTLPVTRKDLLNSKVITGFVAMAAATVVCCLGMLIMSAIEMSAAPTGSGVFGPVIDYLEKGMRTKGFFFWIYIAEGFTLALVLLALVVLFLYFCITFGSMIVKKGKLITSIAIFYGATSLFVSIAQILMIFGAVGYLFSYDPATLAQLDPIVALFLLGLIFYLSMLCCLLYTLQYRMLDKKLNLA